MSLIVEDGSIVTGAESYISVADSLTYHAARGNNTWATITTAQQEQALRRATEYMSQAYRLRWVGYRVTDKQALDWPRAFVQRKDSMTGYGPWPSYFDFASIPVEIQRACAELALKAAAGDLAPDLSQNVVREKIDVIEVVYDKFSPQYVRYRAIDNLLAPFMLSGSNSVKINRV